MNKSEFFDWIRKDHGDWRNFLGSAVILLMLVALAGCGGGSMSVGAGSSAQLTTPPAIANLQYTPAAADMNSEAGNLNVEVTLDFSAPEGTVSSLTVTTFDSSGREISTTTDPVDDAIGINEGILGFSGIVDTTIQGPFTFKLYITDSAGLTSNTLTGTINIV